MDWVGRGKAFLKGRERFAGFPSRLLDQIMPFIHKSSGIDFQGSWMFQSQGCGAGETSQSENEDPSSMP